MSNWVTYFKDVKDGNDLLCEFGLPINDYTEIGLIVKKLDCVDSSISDEATTRCMFYTRPRKSNIDSGEVEEQHKHEKDPQVKLQTAGCLGLDATKRVAIDICLLDIDKQIDRLQTLRAEIVAASKQ